MLYESSFRNSQSRCVKSHVVNRRARFETFEDRRMLSFEPAMIHPTGILPLEVVTADFNNDGQLDLATADAFSNSVSVLLGNANGMFQSVPSRAGVPLPQSLAAGDFNADGKLDLVTANYDDFGDHNLSVLLGNGDGTFAAANPQGSGLPKYSVAVATGHLNSDQHLDLIVLSDDFFGSHHLSVLLGDGAGNFAHSATYARQDFGQLRSPVLADFNGDGRADVVVSDWQTGSVKIFLGNGNGTLQSPRDFAAGAGANSVAIGDLNADGELDLAVTTSNDGRVVILIGNGDGTFQQSTSSVAGTRPTSVKTADLTDDGLLDLVVTNAGSSPSYAGAVSVLAGRGDGSFAPPITIATGGSYANSVTIADFNGDHQLDAAVTNQSSNSVSVLINDGVWTTTPSLQPHITISDVMKAEGNAKSTIFVFTVTLSGASNQVVTVNYVTTNGTATAGIDYQSRSGTVTFAPGETTKTITVAVIGDKEHEADETFFVNLTGASAGDITDGQGVGTILNDDNSRGPKIKPRQVALTVDAAFEDWAAPAKKKRA